MTTLIPNIKKCSYCNTEFSYITNKKKYCSSKCRYKVSAEKYLSQFSGHKCPFCPKEFKSTRSIGNHIKHSHKDKSMKWCAQCNLLKFFDNFTTDKTSLDGKYSWCKVCCNKRNKNWSKTPEVIKSRKKTLEKRLYENTKYHAELAGHKWEISKELFYDLISKPCIYCKIRKKVGLDRKDNSEGYTPTNICSACIDCNRMKLNIWTYEEMLEIGKVVQRLKIERLNKLYLRFIQGKTNLRFFNGFEVLKSI